MTVLAGQVIVGGCVSVQVMVKLAEKEVCTEPPPAIVASTDCRLLSANCAVITPTNCEISVGLVASTALPVTVNETVEELAVTFVKLY